MSKLNLAMWSGPRNLSTALMYSFANRPDFQAIDEPFYACYLTKTGLDHPMGDAVIGSQPTDANQVIDGPGTLDIRLTPGCHGRGKFSIFFSSMDRNLQQRHCNATCQHVSDDHKAFPIIPVTVVPHITCGAKHGANT